MKKKLNNNIIAGKEVSNEIQEESKKFIVLVAMYDKVVGVYSTPMAFDCVASASRWFSFYLQKADIMAEPSDFELYLLGYYNVDNASIDLKDKPEFIMKGVAK